MKVEALEPRRMLSSALVMNLPEGVYPADNVAVGGIFYFSTAEAGQFHNDDPAELWRSDGTAPGTFAIKDPDHPASPLVMDGRPTLVPLASKLIVFTNQPGLIYAVDNATAQATLLPAVGISAVPSASAVMGGVAYFGLNDLAESDGNPNIQAYEDELWRTDGTALGTYLVKDIQPKVTNPSFYNAQMRLPTAAGSRLFFTAKTAESGDELWVSDGTTAGTHLVADLRPGVDDAGFGLDSDPFDFVPLGDRLVFRTMNTKGFSQDDVQRLWISDGTAKGTQQLVEGESIGPLSRGGKFVYFVRSDNNVATVWRTDGTRGGTIKLIEGDITDARMWADRLYFYNNGTRMVSDGTPAGTHEGVPPFEVSGIVTAAWPSQVGSTFVFSAQPTLSPVLNLALFATDGTAAGTRQLTDFGGIDGFTAGASRAFFYKGVAEATGPLSVYDPGYGGIAGTVFDDLDADGVRDAGEAPLRGYKVYLDKNNDGVCNKNELWTRASSTGRYRFDFLPAWTYTVRIVGVEGRRGSTPERYRIKVKPDATATKYFGRTERPIVGGLVYMDANKNGTFDAGEAGMGGWTLFVDADHDGVLDGNELTTVTDALGKFMFTTLLPGTHWVRIVGQTGYRLTAPGAGYRGVSVGVAEVWSRGTFGEKRVTR